MTYTDDTNEFQVGDFVVINRKILSYDWCFEKGTKVKIIGISYRGYDIEDEYGHKKCGIPPECIEQR